MSTVPTSAANHVITTNIEMEIGSTGASKSRPTNATVSQYASTIEH